MKYADYKCSDCSTLREISIPDNGTFPENIPCFGCSGQCRRVFSTPYAIVHQGSVGNAKNGYTSTGGDIKKS